MNTVKPNFLEPHKFHQIAAQIDDCISELDMYEGIISEPQAEKLRVIVNFAQDCPDLDASEVNKQYKLLRQMQNQIVDMNGTLKAHATLKDISSVIAATNSTISLFLKAQKEIDFITEEANLKQAVLEAIGDLDSKVQQKFFNRLNQLGNVK